MCDKQFTKDVLTIFHGNILCMFALKMFYKHLIATGYHTHHFKTFLKCFVSNVLHFIRNVFCTHIFRMLINKHTGTFKYLQTKMVVGNNRGFYRTFSKSIQHAMPKSKN